VPRNRNRYGIFKAFAHPSIHILRGARYALNWVLFGTNFFKFSGAILVLILPQNLYYQKQNLAGMHF
jgi:hypothetical protein